MAKVPEIKHAEGVAFREGFRTIQDITDNGGAISGNVVLESGGALFDGSSGAITYNQHAEINDIFNGGGSIEFWIDPDSDGEGSLGKIADKTDDNAAGWTINTDDEVAGFILVRLYQYFSGTDGAWKCDKVIPINTLSHMIITYDNSSTANNPTFYLNGAAIGGGSASPTGTRDDDSAYPLVLGNTPNDARTYDGHIYELSLYNRILTADEVADRYNSGKGLVDETSTYKEIKQSKAVLDLPMLTQYDTGGVRVIDNEGTLSSTVTLGDGTTASTFPTNKQPVGLDFDNTDYINIPHNALLDFGTDTDFTLMVWIKRDIVTGSDIIMDKRTSGANGYLFWVDTNNDKVTCTLVGAGATVITASTTTTEDRRWRHAVFVADRSGNGQIYIDGEADGAAVDISSAGDINNTNQFTIGARSFSQTAVGWDGKMTKLKVFRSALTPTQIKFIYNNERRLINW